MDFHGDSEAPSYVQHAGPSRDDWRGDSALAYCSQTQRDAGPVEVSWSLRALSSEDLYDQMLNYTLTPQQLYRCGYPQMCYDNPLRVVCLPRDAVYSSRKTCSRCHSSFTITPRGQYYAQTGRRFHPGRRSSVSRFSCCGARSDQPGCHYSRYHICSIGAPDEWNTTSSGFVRTPWRHNIPGIVFAFDCEMSFTIRGIEVTRVRAVDGNCTTIYELYATPGSPVLYYNTVYRSVTTEHLRNERTTLQDVQAVLLRLFSASTVLVSHGLENDLRCPGLVHDTAVDTAVLFLDRRGLPFRQSFRSLVGAYLNREVPEGTLGHDSVKEAKACMQLMLW
ncbi:putative exonuclease GOR [Haemaphysalis longicornis]